MNVQGQRSASRRTPAVPISRHRALHKSREGLSWWFIPWPATAWEWLSPVESIEGHLTIVFTALALDRGPHTRSIKKLVRAARRYRTSEIRAGNQTLTAEDRLPDELRHALHRTHGQTVRTNVNQVGA